MFDPVLRHTKQGNLYGFRRFILRTYRPEPDVHLRVTEQATVKCLDRPRTGRTALQHVRHTHPKPAILQVCHRSVHDGTRGRHKPREHKSGGR